METQTDLYEDLRKASREVLASQSALNQNKLILDHLNNSVKSKQAYLQELEKGLHNCEQSCAAELDNVKKTGSNGLQQITEYLNKVEKELNNKSYKGEERRVLEKMKEDALKMQEQINMVLKAY